MKRYGFANGCFNKFHLGHACFLAEAKRLCDYLIVAVNDDASVRRLKGVRPLDKAIDRVERVAGFADTAMTFDGDVRTLIKRVNPDVLIRGWDQSMDEYGLAPVFIQIPRHGDISTTRIVNGLQQ